jgi:GNAT superfamily N-acetyltransferase
MDIRIADVADLPALTVLINSAYEVERFFKNRDRLSPEEASALLEKGTFLIAQDDSGICGTVFVKYTGDIALFGLLAVNPSQQGNGLGRLLISAAERFARTKNCLTMTLEVVNLRLELPPFYRKLGYKETGMAPFPDEALAKLPCHFIVMSKSLRP